MKQLLILFTLIFCLSCSVNSSSQTPDLVQKTFISKYPGENDPDWHKDKNGNYEAHFKIDGVSYRADFLPSGAWVETETNIDKKELPQAILKIIEEQYDDNKIYEIEKVDHHSKGIFYDVEFRIDGKKKDIEFNAQGNIIN